MQIVVATASIVVITLIVWALKKFALNKLLPRTTNWICPLCLGVLLTWVGFLTAFWQGQPVDLFIPASMMGGSAVGFTYYLEKKLKTKRFVNVWKTFFVVIGFCAIYFLLRENWLWFSIAAALEVVSVLVIVGISSKNSRRNAGANQTNLARLRKQLEDCC